MKMNVLHIVTSLGIGGIEKLCKDYALFSQHNNSFLAIYSEGEVYDIMKTCKQDVTCLNATNFQYFSIKQKIIDLCANRKIDAIVIHHPITIIQMMLNSLKKQIPNISFIFYAHSDATEIVRRHNPKGLKFRIMVNRRAINSADGIIAISESVKGSLIDYLGISNNIEVIYNGIDLQRFKKRRVFESPLRKFIFVGRLVQMKGIQNVLEALGKIDLPEEFRFVIVGEGLYKSELQRLVDELQLQPYVEFCGSSMDIPNYLHNSDAFIHYPDVDEGFGLTVVEAMASGLICICGKKGGLPEIVTHKVNGYLVNTKEELQHIIEGLLHNSNYIEINDISAKAVLRAKDFSVERFSNELDRSIETVYQRTQKQLPSNCI